MRALYGKYRGQVTSNADPTLSGRLQVTAPAALGSAMVWAMPCVPYAGAGVGFFAMPPVGANVWVEFEAGNPEAPIWSGCFWALGELPPTALLATSKILKTDTATITIDDLPGAGGITIETASGQKISITATAIEITNAMGADIQLSGPSVNINSGALEVT